VITTSTNWATANSQTAKMPIYAFAIAGQATVYTTHDLLAFGVTGTLPSYQAWLKTPQGASQTIDPVNGRSSIGELTCEVLDVGGAVTAVAGGNTVDGSIVTLSVGYPGIAWSEFVVLQTYQLYKSVPSPGYTSWIFTSRDKQILTRKTIYLHPENGALLSGDNPWYLCGTPAEIFQAVALFGLGLDASVIDRTQCVTLDSPAEGLYAGVRPFEFAITESFQAQQFLESDVFKPAGMYPVVKNTGQISLRGPRPPAAGVAGAVVCDFNENNLCTLPVVDRMPVVNEVIFRFDYDGSAYQTERYYLEATSLTTFGRGQQWVCESKGLRTELGGQWFAQWAATRLFRRFAGTPTALRGGAPTLQIEAFLMTLPVWAGDYVTVTHSKLPDVTTGAIGVTGRVYEVIDRSPDYAKGRMTYKLLDTGLTGLPAAYQWGGTGATRPLVIGTGTIY